MMSFKQAFNENRRIVLSNDINPNIKDCVCVTKLKSRGRRYKKIAKHTFEGISYCVLRAGSDRQRHIVEEDGYSSFYDSNVKNIAYEVFFFGNLPLNTEIDGLFYHLVNPSNDRQGHIHNIGFEGYFMTSPKSFVLVGYEYLNND